MLASRGSCMLAGLALMVLSLQLRAQDAEAATTAAEVNKANTTDLENI